MKAHKFDAVSFISGLVIAVIGAAFLVVGHPWDVVDALGRIGTWFWPAVLLAVGAAVLAPPLIRAGTKEPEPGSSAD